MFFIIMIEAFEPICHILSVWILMCYELFNVALVILLKKGIFICMICTSLQHTSFMMIMICIYCPST